MTKIRSGLGLVLAALVLACGEPPTDPGTTPLRLQVAPVFRQGSDTPVFSVDQLSVHVSDLEENTLADAVVDISPGTAEVEVEVRIDASPGQTIVIELALRNAGQDVYFGGPVAVVPTNEPVTIDVAYVGEQECQATVGSANIGSIGGAFGRVTGRLELGDCYDPDTESFADRWTLDVPRDAGLDLAAASTGASSDHLAVSLESLDGTVVVEPTTEPFALFIGSGTYVAVVTSPTPLDEVSYELLVGEFDRCDAETGALAPGLTTSQALTTVDCPLASGRAADLWSVVVSSDTPYRIDLESAAFDAQLLLTSPSVLDPFVGSPIDEDDDHGIGSNALLAGVLPAGGYRVWATSFGSGETGPYQISMHALSPGAPTLQVRSVAALGIGGGGGVCGSSYAFLFDFGFEDGDGDLLSPGGVTIRLTGIPSGGSPEIKGLDWDSFSGLNSFAGYTDIVTCETFGSDTAKLAEFFITDAQGAMSAIYSTTLTPTASGPTGPVPGGAAVARLRAVEPGGGLRD
jgi:hypothetical protein